MSRAKLSVVLRWIGVLPCAFLALLLAYLLMFIFSQFPFNAGSWMMVYILPVICAYISGFAYMTVGILVAPSYTRIVAIILSAILLIILRIEIMPVFSSKEYLDPIRDITTVAGSTIAYFSLRDVVEG